MTATNITVLIAGNFIIDICVGNLIETTNKNQIYNYENSVKLEFIEIY